MEANRRQRPRGSLVAPRGPRKFARSVFIIQLVPLLACYLVGWQTLAAGTEANSSSGNQYGNMSALMLSQPSSQMTNTSLVATRTPTSSSNSSQQEQPIAAKQPAGKAARQQPQVVVSNSSSPAQKLKQQQQGAKRPSPEQVMMMMVAANDAHETQAFMPVSSAGAVTVDEAPSRSLVGRQQQEASVVKPDTAKTSRPTQQQQVTTSTTAAWPPAQATPSPPAQRVRVNAAAGPGKQGDYQTRFFSPAQEPVDDKPAGYSYAFGHTHTHTSPLSPARQEMLLASERQRLRGQSEREAHSLARQVSVSGSQQVEQQTLLDPVAGYPRPAHGRTQSAFTGGAMMPAPHLTITGTAASPCRPPTGTFPVQQQQEQTTLSGGESGASLSAQVLPNFGGAAAPKYERVSGGTRLRSQHIFKVLRADSLTDCELACTRASQAAGNNLADACRSFNYRAYFAAENCELSRLELRQLKLEDGAQFEQHTQFDFYATVSAAEQQQAAGSSSSLIYSPFPEADCLDVSQSCSQDGMEFSLRTNEPFMGRIYTYGFHDSCFTDGQGEHSTSLRISRAGGFPRCGTQQLGDLMTNIVVVQFNDFVQSTRDKKYNLTCYFSGPGEAVVTSNYLDTKLDERSHPIQIEHLPAQNVITSNVHLRVLYRGQPTNTIAVGDLLTFRLETRAGRTAELASEIFATNVIAKDPYSGRQVQLIDARGCPVDPVNVFPELQRTPDGALESEFYAFKIPDSNFLIFQATVRTCRAPCEPVICHSGADRLAQYVALGVKGGPKPPVAQVPSWGKRRRRQTDSLEPQESELEALTVGESVEHVIPVRMSPTQGHALRPLPVRTLRRPELSEGAEEEVKEMFRVYMSRAEINRQQRASQPVSFALQQPMSSNLTELPTVAEVCLSQPSYYVMLFALISLTLVMLSVLLVAAYISRRAKFRLSDAIADSIF